MKETVDLTLPSPTANIEIELHPKDTEVLQINFGMDEANSFQNSDLDVSIPEVEFKLKMLGINEENENGPAPYDLENAFVPMGDAEAPLVVNFDQQTLSNAVLKPEDIVVNGSAEEAALYAEYLQYTQQFYNQQLIGELNDETNKSYPSIFPEETAASSEEQQNENIVLNSDSFLSGLNTISINNSNMDTTNFVNHTNKGLFRNVANNSNHSSDAFTSVLSSLTSPPTFPLGSSSPDLFLLSPDQQWQDPEWATRLNIQSISGSVDAGDNLGSLKNWSLADDNRPGSTSSHIMGLNSMSSISADDFDHSRDFINHHNNNNNSFNNINSKMSNIHNSSFNHSININNTSNSNSISNSMYNNVNANGSINRSSLISSIPIITRLRSDSNDSASDSDTEKDKNILNNRDGNILNAHSNSVHSRSTQNSTHSHKNNEINIYSDSYDDSIEWTYQPNTTVGARNSAATSPALVLTPRVPSVPTVLNATKSPGVAQITGQLNTLAINSTSPGASVQQVSQVVVSPATVVVNMGTNNKAAQPHFIPLPPTAVTTKQSKTNTVNNSNNSNNSINTSNNNNNNTKQIFSQQSQYQQQQLQQSLAQKELGNQFIPLHNNNSSAKQQISSPNQMVNNFAQQQQPTQNYAGVRSTAQPLPHQQMQQNQSQNAPFHNSNSNSSSKSPNNMYTAGIQAQYPVPSGTYQNGQHINPSNNSNSNSNSQFAQFNAQQSQSQYNTPPLHPSHSQQQQQQYQHQQYQQNNQFQSSMQPPMPPSFQQPLPQPPLANHFPPQYHTQSLPTRPLQQQQQPQLSQYNGQKPFVKPPSHISSYGNGGSGSSNNKNAEQYIEYVYKVEFKKKCNEYLLSVSCVDHIQIGDVVIVSADSLEVDPHRRGTVTHRGEDLGVLVEIIPLEQYIYTTKRDMKNKPFLSIIRLAYESEKMRIVQKINDEAEVFLYARELAYTVYNLNIQILDAEYQFDRKKLTIYYDCVGKAGFENFVKAMYSTFKTRIWMELWPQK